MVIWSVLLIAAAAYVAAALGAPDDTADIGGNLTGLVVFFLFLAWLVGLAMIALLAWLLDAYHHARHQRRVLERPR